MGGLPPRGTSANYTYFDECRQYGKRDVLALLDHKIEQAKRELQADLERQLYGRKPESNHLRQCIADAYDQVAHGAAIRSALDTYKAQVTEQIFNESPILANLNRQEKKVSNSCAIATSVVAKRAEKRATKRADEVGEYLEMIDWEDGDTLTWTVNFKTNASKTYHYVALRGGENWFITGDACRYNDDGLITKLVSLSLDGKVVIAGLDDE